jgi:hypothetical protein
MYLSLLFADVPELLLAEEVVVVALEVAVCAEEDLAVLLEDFASFWLEEDFLVVPLPSVTSTVSVTAVPSIIHVSETSPAEMSLLTVPLMVKVFALSSYLQSLSLMDQRFQDCLDGWLLRPLNVTGLIAPPLATVCERLPLYVMEPILPSSGALEEELAGLGSSAFCEDEETAGLTELELLEIAEDAGAVAFAEELITVTIEDVPAFGSIPPGRRRVFPSMEILLPSG